MREMAYCSGYQIVLFIVKYDRNGFQRGDELPADLHLFRCHFLRRSQDIISILDQMCFGVCKSAFF